MKPRIIIIYFSKQDFGLDTQPLFDGDGIHVGYTRVAYAKADTLEDALAEAEPREHETVLNTAEY